MKFPDVPGKTPYDRFVNLVRQMIAAPKDAEPPKRKRPKRRRTATR